VEEVVDHHSCLLGYAHSRYVIFFSLLRKNIHCDLAAAGPAYSLGVNSMIRDLHCTRLQATAGLSMYTLGFGLVPLVSASFSEEFGRLPLYAVSGLGMVLMFMMTALSVSPFP
jgi:MFS family permease